MAITISGSTGIVAGNIADGAITTTKIASGAVSATAIADNSLTPSKLSITSAAGDIFKKCSTFSEFVSKWKFSGVAGARTSAPLTAASDPVISNYNYNVSSWTEVDASTIYTANSSDSQYENYYWYIRKLFYITAGSFTLAGTVDDDIAVYLTPYGGGTPILVGGNIADNSGSDAGAFSYTCTVATSGFYYLTARGIDGGGGDILYFTSLSGVSNFWIPETSTTPGGVIQTVYNYTNARTTWGGSSTVLETSITPTSTASKILITGVLYGHANDDSYMFLEYKIGSGSWTKNNVLNGESNLGGWGDHCWTHSSNTGPFPSPFTVLFSPRTTETVSFRVGVNAEATFYLNRGSAGTFAWDGYEGGNTNPNPGVSKSTIILQEIAG